MQNRKYTLEDNGTWNITVENKDTGEKRDLGVVSNMSFTVSREQTPLYTMGSPNPRAFVRGRSAVAGSVDFYGPYDWSEDMRHRIFVIPMPGYEHRRIDHIGEALHRMGFPPAE